MFYHFPETDLYKWWPLKPPILSTAPSLSNFCKYELAAEILTSVCLAKSCTVITLAALMYFIALDSSIITEVVVFVTLLFSDFLDFFCSASLLCDLSFCAGDLFLSHPFNSKIEFLLINE